jgi:O-antigen ligase
MIAGYSLLHGLPAFLAAALAIEGVARKRGWPRLDRNDALLLAGFLVLPTAYAINLAVTGWDSQPLKSLEVLIVAAMLFLGVRAAGLPWQAVPVAALLGAAASAAVGADEVFLRGYLRAEGTTNPIPFGNIALLYVVVGFVTLVVLRSGDAQRRLRWIASVTICAGLFAAWLSQSRGGLVALPFVMAALLSRAFPGGWRLTLSAFTVLAIVIGAALVSEPHLSLRTQQALDEVRTASQAPLATQALGGNSVGTRLHMWQVGWRAFTEAPLMGKGYGAFRRDVVEAGVQTKQVNPELLQHRHLHNDLMNTLAKGGLFGVAALLFFWGVFAWYFWQAAAAARHAGERLLALTGLGTILSFMLYSMTDSMFGAPASAMAMALTLAVCAGCLRHSALSRAGAATATP